MILLNDRANEVGYFLPEQGYLSPEYRQARAERNESVLCYSRPVKLLLYLCPFWN